MKVRLVIWAVLVSGLFHFCFGGELFYLFVETGSFPNSQWHIESYNTQGQFYKSYSIPQWSTGGSDMSGMTTDGETYWVCHDYDRDYIDVGRLGGGSASYPSISIPASLPSGYYKGIAVSDTAVFVCKDIPGLHKVDVFSKTSGAYLHSWNTAGIYVGPMAVTGSSLIINEYGTVRSYTFGGNLLGSFVPSGGWALCADPSRIWLFNGVNTLQAYTHAGARTAGSDVVLEFSAGLVVSVVKAWGPDKPNALLAPEGLDLGSLTVGTPSTTGQFTVRNTGNQTLTLGGAVLSDAVNFSVSPTGAQSVPAYGSLNYTVTFDPQSAGDFSCVLSLATNDGDLPTAAVNLTGSGKASTVYVDGTRPSSGDGTTWGTAFKSLGDALASPNVLDGAEVWVRGGIYAIGERIIVDKAVSIFGGFTGTETQRGERDPAVNTTVIDAGNVCGCMKVTVSGYVTLDGLCFRNGRVVSPVYYGGGVHLENAQLNARVVGCVFESCYSGYTGGGLHSGTVASAVIEDCTFMSCTASQGMAVSCGNGAEVRGCEMTGNSGDQGAIYAEGNAQIVRCVVRGNTATNTTMAGVNLGYGSGPVMRDCLITGNRVSGGGAGSGINTSGSCTIANCTVVDNSVRLETGTLIYNSIVWDMALEQADFTNYGTVRSCCIKSVSYGTSTGQDANGNTRQYPMFLDPDGADNDPVTYGDNDYTPAAGSVCVDAGNGDYASNTDLAGHLRFDDVNRTDTGSGTPSFTDIGAYECMYMTPDVIYVDAAASGSGTGFSWADAVTDLQQALDIVPLSRRVYIRAGTYTGLPLEVQRDCEIYGGFGGNETYPEERDLAAFPTVLDGLGSQTGITIAKHTTLLDGLDFYRCAGVSGGGIQGSYDCNLTVRNCDFDACAVTVYGSGIFVSGDVTVERSRFTGFTGPAIYCTNGAAVVKNTLIAGGRGHGVNVTFGEGTSLIENCTIVENPWSYAVYSSSATVNVVNSILRGNTGVVLEGTVSYSNVDMGSYGLTNINADPLFAAAGSWDDNGTPGDTGDDVWTRGDYHLQSSYGRWDSGIEDWVYDGQTSASVDAGDFESVWQGESWPSGRRINQGCYGGTAEASRSAPIGPDLTLDGWVDMRDAVILLASWLQEDFTCDIAPVGGDGIIDMQDYTALCTVYEPEPESVEIDFEGGVLDPSFAWATGGNPGWSVLSYYISEENQYHATSGKIPAYNNSWLQLTIDTGILDRIRFDYWVYTPSNIIVGEFYVDGVKVGNLTEKTWTTVEYSITPGVHTFKWLGKNNYWFNNNNDSLRLDTIRIFAGN